MGGGENLPSLLQLEYALSSKITLNLYHQCLWETFDNIVLVDRKKCLKLAFEIKLPGFDNLQNLCLQLFVLNKCFLK